MLSYSVDAYFDAKGEVFSPLLITEFLAIIPNQGTQWVEIANTSVLSIDLAGYKIGDAAKPLPGAIAEVAVSSFEVVAQRVVMYASARDSACWIMARSLSDKCTGSRSSACIRIRPSCMSRYDDPVWASERSPSSSHTSTGA